VCPESGRSVSWIQSDALELGHSIRNDSRAGSSPGPVARPRDRGDRDRMRVVYVGLPTMTSVLADCAARMGRRVSGVASGRGLPPTSCTFACYIGVRDHRPYEGPSAR
jgi:hypothetical protein